MKFEWDENKDKYNIEKHNIPFEYAQQALLDEKRVIAEDIKHSKKSQKKIFLFGKVNDVILIVRFTIPRDTIRIFGAGVWRE